MIVAIFPKLQKIVRSANLAFVLLSFFAVVASELSAILVLNFLHSVLLGRGYFGNNFFGALQLVLSLSLIGLVGTLALVLFYRNIATSVKINKFSVLFIFVFAILGFFVASMFMAVIAFYPVLEPIYYSLMK